MFLIISEIYLFLFRTHVILVKIEQEEEPTPDNIRIIKD